MKSRFCCRVAAIGTAAAIGMLTLLPGTAGAAGNGAKYVPLTPTRVLDTRDSTPLGPAQHRRLTFRPGQLPPGADAVVLNLTGVDPSKGTFVTASPSGTGPVTVSSLNLNPHETRANQVTVPRNDDGSVDLYNNSGFVNLVVDLSGAYVAGDGDGYTAVSPSRLLDTRDTGHLGSAKTVTIDLHGKVPDTATAVTVNLTAINPSNVTYLTLYPAGGARPVASTVNAETGRTTPNQATVPIGADRSVVLYNNFGVTDAAVDLVGYYAPESAGEFHAVSPPTRIEDTRSNGVPLGADDTMRVSSTLQDTAPVSALAINLTGVHSYSPPTFVTTWAHGGTRPFTSNLNLDWDQTGSNAATVPVTPGDGSFDVYNAFGATDIVADLQGYFTDGGAR